MKFIETSAKDNTKVQEAFELLTSEIIKSNLNKEKGLEKKENVKQNKNPITVNKNLKHKQ